MRFLKMYVVILVTITFYAVLSPLEAAVAEDYFH